MHAHATCNIHGTIGVMIHTENGYSSMYYQKDAWMHILHGTCMLNVHVHGTCMPNLHADVLLPPWMNRWICSVPLPSPV